MARSDSQIDKPQRGHPKRAMLSDVNINTGVQSINTERASLNERFRFLRHQFITSAVTIISLLYLLVTQRANECLYSSKAEVPSLGRNFM